MLATIAFSILAAFTVWLAGRGNAARAPRLTAAAFVLLAVFPALLWLPKIPLLPADLTDLRIHPVASAVGWWLGALWFAGCLVALVKLLLAWRTLRHWRSQSQALDLTIEGFELRLLDGLRGPVACGVIHPVVFVPASWPAWDEERQRSVLLHECAHHRRSDPLMRWLSALLCAVHWFNPCVHWMARRLALQCEHECDLEVLRAGVQADHYAHLLCDIATERMPTPACAMAEQNSLDARVRHLMAPRRAGGVAGLLAWLLLAASTAALATIGKQAPWKSAKPDAQEVQERLTADPFPADR